MRKELIILSYSLIFSCILFLSIQCTRTFWWQNESIIPRSHQQQQQQEKIQIPEIDRDPRLLPAMIQGLAMILVSEMGDETFIIAAIMAMRHPRLIIFTGAISALILMTVISSVLGVIVPTLISPELTHHAATILYCVFGARLLYIAYKSGSNEIQDEIDEVQEKLNESQTKENKLRKMLAYFCTPILIEALIMTFIAEWGDRSQIATITLASHLNPIGITIGAILGHSICTGIAVIGGKLVAMKISQRTAALCGSILFFVFAIHNIAY